MIWRASNSPADITYTKQFGDTLEVAGVGLVQTREFVHGRGVRVVADELHKRAGEIVVRDVIRDAGFVDFLLGLGIEQREEDEVVVLLEGGDGFLDLILAVLEHVVDLFHVQVRKLRQHGADHVAGERPRGIGDEMQGVGYRLLLRHPVLHQRVMLVTKFVDELRPSGPGKNHRRWASGPRV